MSKVIRFHRSRQARIADSPLPGRGEGISTPISDDDKGIRESEIPRMVQYVLEYKNHPDVIRLARTIVKPCETKDQQCEVKALFEWAKSHMRYVNDTVDAEVIQTPVSHIAEMQTPIALIHAILGDEMIEAMRNHGEGFRALAQNQIAIDGCFKPTLAGPLAKSSGDCDEGATFLATMLAAVGITPRFRFGGSEKPDGQESWQHVWVQATLDHGNSWIDLDVTEQGADMGWYYPGFTAYGHLNLF